MMSSDELHSFPSSSSGNGSIHVIQKIKLCVRSPNCTRRLKNSGAILVATWCYLVTAIYYYIGYTGSRNYSTITFSVTQAVGGLLLPLIGWLADVRFGRYKVISCSLWMMWISCLLYMVTLIILSEVTHFKFESSISLACLILMSIGYCGFQANIIQFGTDQLIDASSTEIRSFIAWCSWTFFASDLGMHFLFKCVNNKLFAPFLLCCNLTVAVVINILFKHVLVKEPPTQNPFKLVYKVLAYAIRNKYPQQRSAFTYCEDGIPSRIDFGKRKYGGPFTTEQVEDVKTLFRVSVLCLTGGALFAFTESWSSLNNNLFRNEEAIQQFSKCSSDYIITGMYFISGTILLPLYELIIYPVFYRCSVNTKSSWKVISGAIIAMVRYIATAALTIQARHNHRIIDHNSTLQCSLHEPSGVLGTYVDHRWTALLDFLNAVSDLLMIIGMLEFYCAQVPYSMKGMVAGIAYCIIALNIPAHNAIEKVFEKPALTWSTGEISCEFWYFVTMLAILTMLLAVSFIVLKWYKKRKREDVLPNEHIFAERYYSS